MLDRHVSLLKQVYVCVITQAELRSGSLAEQQSQPHMVLMLPACCFYVLTLNGTT